MKIVRPIGPDGLTAQQRSEKVSKAFREASIKLGAFGTPSYERLEKLLAEARGKLVERDVEIAGMKTELARLYDRIADLERSK